MNEITFTFWEARSRLNRSRILQVDTRVKAFDEIYKIYRLLHRTNLNISANTSSEIFQNEYLYSFFTISRFLELFHSKLCYFYIRLIHLIFCRNYSATLLSNCKI